MKTLTSNNKGRREIRKILMNLSDNRTFCILTTFDDVENRRRKGKEAVFVAYK